MPKTLKTDVVTGARRQRVVIERHQQSNEHPEWWVMFNSGAIEVFDTADAALKAVNRRSLRGNKTITITRIEWRNVPDGWTPPKGPDA